MKKSAKKTLPISSELRNVIQKRGLTAYAAAKRAGVRAIGIEKSEDYCRMAAARLGSLEHSIGDPGSLFAAAQP